MVTATIARMLLGGLLTLIGLSLMLGGGWLLFLGGSVYYLLAGLTCLVVAAMMLKQSGNAPLVYGLFLFATLIWAVAEVGLAFWMLLPRLAGPAVLALLLAIPFVARATSGKMPRLGAAVSGGSAAVTVGLLAVAWWQSTPRLAPSDAGNLAVASADAVEWSNYGQDIGGTRFSPAATITPANVAQLEPAWTYRTGDSNALRPEITTAMSFMATPIMADGRLTFCTPLGNVIALDPDTGRQIWRFEPKAQPGAAQMLNCRGVSWHDNGGTGVCDTRILSTTVDGRLIALDAATGRKCSGFGTEGEVSLAQGLGQVDTGATYTTSPPVIVGNTAVLGAYIRDNFSTDEPAGVVRAYDTGTGELLWAWDAGRPDDAGPLLPGETWSRGSPNAWSVLSADPELGLIYVPTGNATPDHVGMHRTALQERYASSVVALDARTGRVRWAFRTTHHDLWDYDVPAQPVLFEYPVGNGTIPAVAVPTKRGEIFVLNRRNGQPLTGMEERPVPKGDVPGETYAATQPYATGFPTLRPARLKEADMWGATPIDQLWCRIRFRSLDYEGDFTPPSTRGAIQYPGIFGMLNWGSVSIDPRNGLMIANSSAIPQVVTLHPRGVAEGPTGNSHEAGFLPQEGTPYGLTMTPMTSPLGIPCPAPPWGHLTAINFAEKDIAWQRPLGTSADIAPLGIAVPGVFSIGGSAVTAGGLTFIGATLDDYLRAFDTRTGQELWRGRLPAGGQATPMTYVSGTTGRQYVVIAAGGHAFLGSTLGDHLVAYALPQ